MGRQTTRDGKGQKTTNPITAQRVSTSDMGTTASENKSKKTASGT